MVVEGEQKAKMNSARAHVESLLRAKQLDRTLSPSWAPDLAGTCATGIGELDRALGGGLPHGQVSEVVGPRSSGRMGFVCALLASVTRRGDLAALVDVADAFDPGCAHQAGVVLPRMLWVRGRAGVSPATEARAPRVVADARQLTHATRAGARAARAATDVVGLAIDRAVKATHLLLQSGLFAVVVLDCADIAPQDLRRLPFTTWRRLQRGIEGSAVVGVVVSPVTGTRSAGGMTLSLTSLSHRARWRGDSARARLFDGLHLQAIIGRARHAAASDCVTWRLDGLHE